MINIVVTSKPVDGLLYYSYEYSEYLNSVGVPCQVIIICHRKFTKEDYVQSIKSKYITFKNVVFDTVDVSSNDITLIMGRSMMSLAFQDFKSYSQLQQNSLKDLFSKKLISVYSENHPTIYPLAVDFFSPLSIIDLCDTEIYPNGVGEHFEKRINFDIYLDFKNDVQFEHLFLGTNPKYYQTAERLVPKYTSYGILTYNDTYINHSYNNVFVPIENLMGIFNTYVYAKETFDPAPRIIQECKFFNKGMIYDRDKSIVDGGSVYWKRPLDEIDVAPILKAYEDLY